MLKYRPEGQLLKKQKTLSFITLLILQHLFEQSRRDEREKLRKLVFDEPFFKISSILLINSNAQRFCARFSVCMQSEHFLPSLLASLHPLHSANKDCLCSKNYVSGQCHPLSACLLVGMKTWIGMTLLIPKQLVRYEWRSVSVCWIVFCYIYLWTAGLPGPCRFQQKPWGSDSHTSGKSTPFVFLQYIFANMWSLTYPLRWLCMRLRRSHSALSCVRLSPIWTTSSGEASRIASGCRSWIPCICSPRCSKLSLIVWSTNIQEYMRKQWKHLANTVDYHSTPVKSSLKSSMQVIGILWNRPTQICWCRWMYLGIKPTFSVSSWLEKSS